MWLGHITFLEKLSLLIVALKGKELIETSSSFRIGGVFRNVFTNNELEVGAGLDLIMFKIWDYSLLVATYVHLSIVWGTVVLIILINSSFYSTFKTFVILIQIEWDVTSSKVFFQI